MLTFYNHPVSNFGAKVAIVLALKGVAHEELLPPGGYGSAEYKAIVPAGTIPAIVEDGLVLSESDAIMEYLDETRPTPPLMPSTPAERARVRQLMRFHDSRLEPPLRALFGQMAPATRDAAVVAARMDEVGRRLAELEALIEAAPFATGPELTLADAAFPGTLLMGERMAKALAVTWPAGPKLRAWAAALAALPAVAGVLERSEVATRAWLVAKGAA